MWILQLVLWANRSIPLCFRSFCLHKKFRLTPLRVLVTKLFQNKTITLTLFIELFESGECAPRPSLGPWRLKVKATICFSARWNIHNHKVFHNRAGLIIMWVRHAIAIITVYVTKYCKPDELSASDFSCEAKQKQQPVVSRWWSLKKRNIPFSWSWENQRFLSRWSRWKKRNTSAVFLFYWTGANSFSFVAIKRSRVALTIMGRVNYCIHGCTTSIKEGSL